MKLHANILCQKERECGSDKKSPDWTEIGWGLLNRKITEVLLFGGCCGWIFSVLNVIDLFFSLKEHIEDRFENTSWVVTICLIMSNWLLNWIVWFCIMLVIFYLAYNIRYWFAAKEYQLLEKINISKICAAIIHTEKQPTILNSISSWIFNIKIIIFRTT